MLKYSIRVQFVSGVTARGCLVGARSAAADARRTYVGRRFANCRQMHRPPRRALGCTERCRTGHPPRRTVPLRRKNLAISESFHRDFDPNLRVISTLIRGRAPVVFRFNPWYYLHAFVALVSLLTRLTRLPGEGSVGLIFWRARQAGAQIAF